VEDLAEINNILRLYGDRDSDFIFDRQPSTGETHTDNK
jgi:hypothetical protein